MGLLLLILLVLLLVGLIPRWPYSKDYGNGPMSIVGVAVIVVLILIVLGILPARW